MGGQGVGTVGPEGNLPPPPEGNNGLFGGLDIGTLISGLGAMMGGNKKPEPSKESRKGPKYKE
jgi:hypothetical protein